jgi:hypothetical protein
MNDFFDNILHDTKDTHTFRLISSKHPLDLYLGYNNYGKKTLALIVENVNFNYSSTKFIEVKINTRSDGKRALCFSLLDDTETDIFYRFCEDIFDSTIMIPKEDGEKVIYSRWNRWINMFKYPHSLIMSEKEIRGLIGELVFLRDYMFNKYSIEESITSWIGPINSHKDFEIRNLWYEIKSCYQSSKSITISSIEQLDSKFDGYLCIIELEESNKFVTGNLSLNNLVNQIYDMIPNEKFKQDFLKKVSDVGYSFFEEYDNYVYYCKNINKYLVNENFPRLRKKNIPKEIANVSYELLIPNLKEFLVEV